MGFAATHIETMTKWGLSLVSLPATNVEMSLLTAQRE